MRDLRPSMCLVPLDRRWACFQQPPGDGQLNTSFQPRGSDIPEVDARTPAEVMTWVPLHVDDCRAIPQRNVSGTRSRSCTLVSANRVEENNARPVPDRGRPDRFRLLELCVQNDREIARHTRQSKPLSLLLCLDVLEEGSVTQKDGVSEPHRVRVWVSDAALLQAVQFESHRRFRLPVVVGVLLCQFLIRERATVTSLFVSTRATEVLKGIVATASGGVSIPSLRCVRRQADSGVLRDRRTDPIHEAAVDHRNSSNVAPMSRSEQRVRRQARKLDARAFLSPDPVRANRGSGPASRKPLKGAANGFRSPRLPSRTRAHPWCA